MGHPCAVCGNNTGTFTKISIKDGYLCQNCLSRVPSALFSPDMTAACFKSLIRFVEKKQAISETFSDTYTYRGIHLDTSQGYFYLDRIIFRGKYLYFKLADVKSFKLVFLPDKGKEGSFADSVKGELDAIIEMDYPECTIHVALDKNVSAPAKSRPSSNGSYENPEGMDDCETFVNGEIRYAKEHQYGDDSSREENNSSNDDYSSIDPSGLKQAMVLFSLESLDGVTRDHLKQRRNRLIKTFHPDNGEEVYNTRAAQKINDAFDILCGAVGSSRSPREDDSGDERRLKEAMTLYMLDSLDGVTKDQLRQRRDRLTKTFRTENGEETDSAQFGRIINEAYSVLCSAIGCAAKNG